MNIGYIKSRTVLQDDAAYQAKLKEFNAVTLYADKQGEAVALRDLLINPYLHIVDESPYSMR